MYDISEFLVIYISNYSYIDSKLFDIVNFRIFN